MTPSSQTNPKLTSSCRRPRCSISLTICLALTLGPSTFAPCSSSSLSPISVAEAAPALWTPFVDAFDKSGGLFGSLFKKPEKEQSPPPTIVPVQENKQEIKEEANDKVAKFSDEVLATAEDYGVVQLDLEGDPNCDYTTKVRIAGSEYNVIIDTGSAHFAVASNACRDCIIPHRDNWRPNEEEEIPIDDANPINKASSDAPLRLFKDQQPTLPSHTTLSSTSTSGSGSQLPTSSTTMISVTTTITSTTTPTAAASTQSQAVLHMSRNSTLENQFDRIKSAIQRKNLAAAPAENLYTLSNSARENGQPIQVSYGIKSHSVGWNGVMTSDLMTLEMAKVEPKNIPSRQNIGSSLFPRLEAGGAMEKEINVEFAAITENNAFFSQECGAQHGIWGLGYRTLSVDRKPTLFDTLSAAMKIPNGFALQLCGRTGNTTKSGNMFLGGYSSSHVVGEMQYVPLVKKDWYQVQLDGFRVMGQPVQGMQNLNLPKTIVDSGTTNVLMSHYNLQFLIQALAHSSVIQWSELIPQEDIMNFWFKNAVLRLPRSSFQVETGSRAVEVVMSGVAVPIYTSSFLRIKSVPAGMAPAGYVDMWWHGFASSTPSDQIGAERASGGAVMPGSVGTILGETLFAGKVVYFERGNNEAEPGAPDFGRIGFARGKNCFGPSEHASVDVLASEGALASVEDKILGPVRVAATSHASGSWREVLLSNGKKGGRKEAARTDAVVTIAALPSPHKGDGATANFKPVHMPMPQFAGPIRLMGSAAGSFMGDRYLLQKLAGGIMVAMAASMM
ncbi:Beta-secretase 2 [Podila verticillata]|nr:Beta-secretase 2 [Podila verticillata]